MNISHDEWIRTTEEGHEQVVCSFLQRVKDRGDIYKDTYEASVAALQHPVFYYASFWQEGSGI